MTGRGSVGAPFGRVGAGGGVESLERPVAIEQPVSIEFDGLGYAVTMATPADLIDLAYGFALTERIIERAGDIEDVGVDQAAMGTMLRITLAPHCRERVHERVRHQLAGSSCGLCGIENLEQALRPLPKVEARTAAMMDAVFCALGRMHEHQPLNQATGAVHAAMACSADGSILIAREDIGRHNAFDKLIGAMLRAGQGWDGGFALLSSRCSYELVEKAALSGCPMLVTVSAATSLALERASEAGIRLVSLAREDSMLVAR